MVQIEDDGFRNFAVTLTEMIDRQPKLNSDQLARKQADQFISLTSMEREFRETLVKSAYGPWAYKKFIQKICYENGNILTSRPYFRERQEVCIGDISQALKKEQVQSLYRFHFNYNFIAWLMKTRKWTPNGRLSVLARKIERLRWQILVENMPLTISQANLFWRKAPLRTNDTRFSFMDFVQIGADGLLSAIDKFCLPPRLTKNPTRIRVWRAVAIGRMRGNFIEMFSETVIHFYPRDKRILYNANKLLREFVDGVDFVVLCEKVNKVFGPDGPTTTPEELQSLMSAAYGRVKEPTAEPDQEDGVSNSVLEKTAAEASWQPDVRFEEEGAKNAVKAAIFGTQRVLSLVEQKLLRMRGVAMDSI